MIRAKSQICALLACLAAAAVSGCGVFDTREPEPPDTGEQIPFENPTDPEIVLTNVKATLEAKSVTNYDNSLTEDFSYEPDQLAVAQAGSDYFEGWTKDDEVGVTTQILNTEASIALVWGEERDVRDRGTSDEGEQQQEFRDMSYSLIFTQGQESVTISGKANMFFRETGGAVWEVYRWEDNSDGSGNDTWGVLRWTRGVDF